VTSEEIAYEFADAQVLENVLENRVGLDVVVGQPSMDEGVVLIVIEAVADRPEAGHRGAVVLVQQVAKVLDLALINTQLLNHVVFNVLLDMACDPRAQRVQSVVEVEEQAVELGLLDLVAAVFELHVSEVWRRTSCREREE
jgi:hypothetical protein